MRTDKVRFPGSAGHRLVGRVDRPDAKARAWILFAHCFTCGKDLKALSRLSRSLVDRGFGVLRFDFTGLGESEGDFADTTFASNLDDLRAAAAWLEAEYEAPRLLVGHSLGGAAVLAVAEDLESVQGVATLGAPADTSHLSTTLLKSAPELSEADQVEVRLAGRPIRVGRALVEDLAEERLLDRVRRLRVPVVVLHSPVDEVVGVDHARRLMEAAHHPKSFVSLDKADHLLLRDPADARYAGEVISAWASRYVDESSEASLDSADRAPLPRGTVRVEGDQRRYRLELRAGSHTWLADEPESSGGGDEGPTPYDFLLAAVGSCTAITLRMYADRKRFPLESVRVDLSHRKIHAEDCEDCDTEKGKISEIERTVTLRGELEPEMLDRLHQIADRCPVHRTLTSETKIRSRRG